MERRSQLDGTVHPLEAIRRGVRVAAHTPILFVAAVPALLGLRLMDLIGAGRGGISTSFDPQWQAHWRFWVMAVAVSLVCDPLALGTAIVAVGRPGDGRMRWPDGVAKLGRCAPSLMVRQAASLVADACLFFLFLYHAGTLALLGVFAIGGYVCVRLAFWSVVIVVDGAGPIDGLRRSFHATRGCGCWWRTAALLGWVFLLKGCVHAVVGVDETDALDAFLEPLGTAILTMAYLGRIDALAGGADTEERGFLVPEPSA
jgi:hypothetical protein